MTAEPSPPLAPEPADKSDEQSSSLPLWLKVLAVLILGGTVELIIYGYVEKPGWIGSSGKQFWDYLDLLIVPAALALGVYWLNWRETVRQDQAQAVQRKRELEVENQRAQDAALQAYLDRIENLLLDKDTPLGKRLDPNGPDIERNRIEKVRTLARARTVTLLRTLNAHRKRSVLDFLYEARLINDTPNHPPDIELGSPDLDYGAADLSGADLRGAVLRGANLSGPHNGANLSGADLRVADLSSAKLRGANLSRANLSRANLSRANLSKADVQHADLWNADLSGANLSDAKLSGAELGYANMNGVIGATSEELKQEAKGLNGATMPDGQKYEDWLKDQEGRGEDAENK